MVQTLSDLPAAGSSRWAWGVQQNFSRMDRTVGSGASMTEYEQEDDRGGTKLPPTSKTISSASTRTEEIEHAS